MAPRKNPRRSGTGSKKKKSTRMQDPSPAQTGARSHRCKDTADLPESLQDPFSLKIEKLQLNSNCLQNHTTLGDEDCYYVLKNVSRKPVDEQLLSMSYCDLVLLPECSRACEAHRAVFSMYSSLFKGVLANQESTDVSVVLLPDYRYEDITNLVQFLYFGTICLPAEDSESLQRIMKELGFNFSSSPLTASNHRILTEKGFIELEMNSVAGEPLSSVKGTCEDQPPVPTEIVEKFSFDKDHIVEDERTNSEYEFGALIDRVLEDVDQKKRKALEAEPDLVRKKPSLEFELEQEILPPKSPLSVSDYLSETKLENELTGSPPESEEEESQESVNVFGDSFPTDGIFGNDEDGTSPPFFVDGFLGGGKETNTAKKLSAVRRRRYSNCTVCGVEFLINRLLQHMKKEHSFQGRLYFCAYCPEVFCDSKDRQEHETSHPEDVDECDICGYKTSRRKMRHHRDKTHLAKVKQFKCDICSETVPQAERVLHRRRHEECISRFACDRCGKVYYRKHSLMNHMKAEHGDKKKFYCSTCKKFFNSDLERKEHIKIHRRRDEKKCQVCGEGLSSTMYFSHLKRHAAHEILSENPLACPRCSRKFLKPEHTINHMIAHLDPPRSNECDICFFPSRTATLGEKHKLREHGTVKKKKVKQTREFKSCVKCGVLVPKGERYKRHLLQHALAELGQDESETDVQCPVCFRVFPCTMFAANHFLSHYEPERVFECERCFTATQTETDLAFHRGPCLGKKVYDARKSERRARAEKKVILGSVLGTFAWLCSECALVFETEQECEAHCASLHTYEEVQC